MSNPLHEIDKLFRDGINGRSEYPPKKVWDSIESELDKETVTKYKRKYNSLKRKTSILLALFLGVVIYSAVELNDRKEKTVESQYDSTAEQLQTASTDNSVQTKGVKRSVQQANIALEKSEDLKSGQLPGAITTLEEEINTIERNLSNSKPGAVTVRKNATANKQVHSNGIINVNEDFTSSPPATANAYELSNGLNLAGVTSATGKTETKYPEDQVKRSLLFSMTAVDDSWEKVFANNTKPTVINPVQLSTNYTIAKKLGISGSRFSLALQFSTMGNWNTIHEDQDYRRWRGGGGNGNSNNNGNGNGNINGGGNTNGNGSGNNGGGNVSGGNWGGTNGSGNSWGGRDNDRHDLKESEYNRLSYTTGVTLGYRISKRISLLTGLNYQLNSARIKSKKIYADKDNNGNFKYLLNCSAGYTTFSPPQGTTPNVHDSITISKTRNFSSYLGVPFIVEYRILSSGKFSLAASAGGQVNFLLNAKTKSVLGEGTPAETTETSKTKGLKPSYFSVLASITGEMQLNKNISLTIAPAGQFGLTYVNTKRSLKTRTNYVGLTAGLKLRL